MKLKGVIIVVCMILLCGCQSSSSKGGLDMYKGKDGKDTYAEAMKYFNKTVKYYRTETSSSSSNTVSEAYMTSKGRTSIDYLYYSTVPSILTATAVGNDKRIMVANSTTDYLKIMETKWETSKDMFIDVTKVEGIVIKEVERIDQTNKIIINVKMENTSTTYKDSANQMNSYTINSEGLIESRQVIYYTDNTFSKVKTELPIETYIDINKVSESEFMKKYDTYVEGIKACDGLTATQGYNKLKPLL